MGALLVLGMIWAVEDLQDFVRVGLEIRKACRCVHHSVDTKWYVGILTFFSLGGMTLVLVPDS